MKTIIAILALIPTLAFAQTEIKGLPVTCVAMEKAEKIINSAYDRILLAGVSEVHTGAVLGVFYNAQTASYVITIQGDNGEICFIDAGYGKAPQLGDSV